MDRLKKLVADLNELKAISGKNDKISFLESKRDDYFFRDVLKFMLNDFITTGISKKKMGKDINIVGDTLFTLDACMNYLKKNNTGKDFDIACIQFFLKLTSKDMNQAETQVISDILTKEFKLGISAKTYNKVFKDDLIPVFEVMLAKKFEDHSKKVKGNFIITKKLDGTRCVIIKDNNSIKAYSRTGKEIEGLNEILDEMNQMLSPNSVADGELLAIVDEDMSVQEQFTETLKRSRTKDKNKTGLCFHVFDWLQLDEFKSGSSRTLHSIRKGSLDMYMKSSGDRYPHVKLVQTLYEGSDFSKIAEWSAKATELGWEGCMISLDKPYVCKRTDSLLKVKQMHTMDLRIKSIEEGEGKYVGMMGKCVVEYKGNEVGVGSGWSDDLRADMFENPNDYIGRIIEVQYFEISKDSKTKLESLRFPVFKMFRNDKTEESYD